VTEVEEEDSVIEMEDIVEASTTEIIDVTSIEMTLGEIVVAIVTEVVAEGEETLVKEGVDMTTIAHNLDTIGTSKEIATKTIVDPLMTVTGKDLLQVREVSTAQEGMT
jgi:hypothetical protein